MNASPENRNAGTLSGAADCGSAEYEVSEYFHSWQGEGVHVGRSAFFIRLFGCPIRCAWCDSSETWADGGRIPERISARELSDAAFSARPDFVVITGGEPAIRDLNPLCRELHSRGLRVHLETSGAFPIRGDVDWLTISPKRARPPLRENLERASELKFIVARAADIEFWTEEISRARVPATSPIWLHPEWSKREDSAVLGAISAWVRERGFPFRAGWQLHKLFNAR